MTKTKPIEELANKVKKGDLVRIELESSGQPDEPTECAGFFYGSGTPQLDILCFANTFPATNSERPLFLSNKTHRVAGLKEEEDPLHILDEGSEIISSYRKATGYEIMNR